MAVSVIHIFHYIQNYDDKDKMTPSAWKNYKKGYKYNIETAGGFWSEVNVDLLTVIYHVCQQNCKLQIVWSGVGMSQWLL